MKKLLFAIACILCAVGATAQTVTIKGKVISDDDKLPAIGAYVRLNASDSAKRSLPGRVVLTDVNGIFTITSQEAKNDITISYIGSEEHFVKIEPGKRNVDLGTIVLRQGLLSLDEVVVTATPSMAKVVGDTVQYRASSFKTNPDATAEDLIKKMPGVTTDSDGSVSSQGQKIGKVLVNGKEYFESDPSMALKSLPSDAVENVQMYDDKTDASRFSGFDDGERVRTINIVTKPGVTNSVFGRAFVGYGTDDRYTTGVGANIFKDDHRFTVVFQSNNVNNQGFTLSDISGGGGFGGGGRGMMRSSDANVGQYSVSASGGIRKSTMTALNYNGSFKDKLKLSASYSFANIGAEMSKKDSTTYMNDTDRFSWQRSASNSMDNRHNFNARVEWTPSKNNRIIFNPKIIYGLNSGFSDFVSGSQTTINFPSNNNVPATIDSRGDNNTKYETFSGSADLWWQHAFSKPGRTMSMGSVLTGNKGLGALDKYMQENTIAISEGYVKDSLINQLLNLSTSGYTLTGSASYTEPISKSSRISANYNVGYNRSISDQQGLNWDNILQDYVLLDPSTTNALNRNYTTQTLGLNYNYVQEKKITLNLGLDYLMANQNSYQDQLSIGKIQSQHFFRAYQPSLNVRITPKQGQNLNLDLRRSAGFPSDNQLQDVLSVGTSQVTQGNPDLVQSYSTLLRIFYNVANAASNTNFIIGGSATQISDQIASSTRFLKSDTTINGTQILAGKRYTTYQNMDGYWNVGAFSNFSMAVKPIKSNANIGARYSFSRQPSLYEGQNMMSNSHNISMVLSLTSNISENVDFTLRYDPGVMLNSSNNIQFDRYYSHNFSGFLNLYLTKNLFINSDASWRNNFGTSAGYGQHYTLLNAAIGYKFLGMRQAEFKVQGYDLLGQNQSFSQRLDDTRLTESTTFTVLKRYFMFSFTYKFDTRKNRTANNFGTEGGSGPRGPERRMMHQ